MGEAWSVFIVPKRPWEDLRRAAIALLDGWGDEEARFGVAPFDAEHLVFQVEHDNGRYTTVAGSGDSGLVLHEALGGRVTELHGSSNTDSVWIAAYDRGRTVDTHDSLTSTAHRLKRFKIDMGKALEYGGFGVSPSELVEDWTLPLHGPPPDARQVLRFEVFLAQHTADTDAAAIQVEEGVAAGLVSALEGVGLLVRLKQDDRALAVLEQAPADTGEQRVAIHRLSLRHGWSEAFASWADDPSALPLENRVELLEALGRADEAHAVALEADRDNVEAYIEEAFTDGNRFAKWWPQKTTPVRTLVYRAAEADVAQRRMEPLPAGLLDDLEAAGVAELSGLAEKLRATARVIGADPVRAIRRHLEHLSDRNARRPWLGKLALALDARNDPGARDALVVAHQEYVSDPKLRRQIADALDRRGGPPALEDDEGSAGPVAGLPESTPEARSAFEALEAAMAGQPSTPEDAARLARARFDAGYEDAASWLEEAYLALGYNSPMRLSLEEALGALGLF